MKNIFLEGDSIYLRSSTAEDFGPNMVEWVNNRQVTKYLVRGTTPGNLEEFANEFRSMVNNRTDIQLTIVEKKSNTAIGITGLHRIEWIARHAEFRILIGNTDMWGKGYGTEAAHLMLHYGFRLLNMEKIWLGVNAANAGAYKSYLKAGYVEEGRLRNEVFRNGTYFDVIRMSMLKSEFEKTNASWAISKTVAQQLKV